MSNLKLREAWQHRNRGLWQRFGLCKEPDTEELLRPVGSIDRDTGVVGVVGYHGASRGCCNSIGNGSECQSNGQYRHV